MTTPPAPPDLGDLLAALFPEEVPPDPEPPVPLYLDPAQTTEGAIRTRVLGRFPQPYDRTEGQFPWDTTAGAILELAQAAEALRFTVRRVWAQTATGDDLDEVVVLAGLQREPATAATVALRFWCAPGTVIPQGTQASTPALPSVGGQVPTGDALLPVSGAVAHVFATTRAATAPASTEATVTVDVPAQATVPGAAGNVPAGTVTLLVRPVAGVTAVTNPLPASGGQDEESDDALRQRFLDAVRNPSAGGNRADYHTWAGAVPGVGSVFVAGPAEGDPPVREGYVRLTLTDPNGAPAPPDLCEAVVLAIVRPRFLPPNDPAAGSGGGSGAPSGPGTPDAFTLGGGATYDPAGFVRLGPGQSVALDVPATGDASLGQPGCWRYHLRSARTAGPTDATSLGAVWLRLEATDPATGEALWQRPLDGALEWGSDPAAADVSGGQIPTDGGDPLVELFWPAVDLFWDGARATRVTGTVPAGAPAGAQVTVDLWRFRSAFEDVRDQAGRGVSPIGQRVEARPALVVTVDVAATLEVAQGFDAPTVLTNAEAAVRSYLRALTELGRPNREVQYVRIGALLLGVAGVSDYTGLLVNGGTGNVPLAFEEVPVAGTIALVAGATP